MLVCQSFGLLLGTVVMVPKTAQTVRSCSAERRWSVRPRLARSRNSHAIHAFARAFVGLFEEKTTMPGFSAYRNQ